MREGREGSKGRDGQMRRRKTADSREKGERMSYYYPAKTFIERIFYYGDDEDTCACV